MPLAHFTVFLGRARESAEEAPSKEKEAVSWFTLGIAQWRRKKSVMPTCHCPRLSEAVTAVFLSAPAWVLRRRRVNGVPLARPDLEKFPAKFLSILLGKCVGTKPKPTELCSIWLEEAFIIIYESGFKAFCHFSRFPVGWSQACLRGSHAKIKEKEAKKDDVWESSKWRQRKPVSPNCHIVAS